MFFLSILIFFLLAYDYNSESEKQKKALDLFIRPLSYFCGTLRMEQENIFKRIEWEYILEGKKFSPELNMFINNSTNIMKLTWSMNEKISSLINDKEELGYFESVDLKVNYYLIKNKMIDSLKTALNKHNAFLKSFCKNENLDLEVPSFIDNPQKTSFESYYFSNAPSSLILCSLLQFEIDILTTHKKIMLSYIEKYKDKKKPKTYFHYSIYEDKKQWYVGDTFKAHVNALEYIPEDSSSIKINGVDVPLENGVAKFTLKGELPYGKKKVEIKTKHHIRGRDTIFQKEIEYEVVR